MDMSRRLLGVTIALTGAIVVLAAGCNARPLDAMAAAGMGGANAAGAGGRGAGGRPAGVIPNRNVDILFLIDDSDGMVLAQQNLVRSFPQFVAALRALPGGLPSLHIAVVSSDMGAGDGSISGCNGLGKAGVFQSTARGPCAATNLDPGATYIADGGGGGANYTGDLADVFTCIGWLGESGCGFEHQLAAVARALGADGKAPPSENLGFLRPEALLVVVLLTDEDDCSAHQGSPLFDIDNPFTLQTSLGPPNFRCIEFGHLCDGKRPPRFAPTGSVTDTVTFNNCVASDGYGLMTPIPTLVAGLRALKADPDTQIVVSAITGPTTPYTIHWTPPYVTDIGPWPAMSPACVVGGWNAAEPAIRIAAFVDAFGGSGMRSSICDDSFAPRLQAIAGRIAERITP